MKDRLSSLRYRKYVGVAELSEQAAELLETSDTYQEKGTVTEFPDERTIRYYISESLIPPALEKQGSASVFGYAHLLALLAIKKLQAQNFPIKKIREILIDKTIDELEKLLDGGRETSDAKNEAQRYLETLLFKQGGKTNEIQAPRQSAPLSPINPSRPANRRNIQQSWTRYEIDEGLELHIEKKFMAPSDFRELRTLIEEIEEIIQSYRNKQR